jgi:toluene monooxygenase system protein A
MHEFIITQYEYQLLDVGLERPWYWDHFLEEIETHHHCQQAYIWAWRNAAWRNAVWWNPSGGLGPE